MDIIIEIIAIILTSSVVSAIVTFLLKTFFESKIRHRYEIELEKFKTELSIKANTEHEITERRLEAYPKIVELVYRTRNMSREIVTRSDISPTLFDELSTRAGELEDSLYKYRIDLERDKVFTPIHTYKNILKHFVMNLSDIKYYRAQDDSKKVNNSLKTLNEIYEEIENQHKPIIEKLSKKSSKLDLGKKSKKYSK
ncbi:MAG: hypothetical protein KAJ51_13355 [Thermoplasmata archaeon]|nr:hypothetical protein [Thermoplasmata archaeon]